MINFINLNCSNECDQTPLPLISCDHYVVPNPRSSAENVAEGNLYWGSRSGALSESSCHRLKRGARHA